MSVADLQVHPVHLGRGASAVEEPAFTGELAWYEGYMERHGEDGAEGRLVSLHEFTESWKSWEMHPHGAEVVLCTAGEITLYQETADGLRTSRLPAGHYAINEPGTWHTADVETRASVLVITAGLGTQHRPR